MSGAIDELQHELGALLAGLTVEQVQKRPAARAEAWSVQQIAEHLLRTYDLTLGIFEERLLKGRCTKAKPTMQQRLAQWGITRLGYFPRGRKAPEQVTPQAVLPAESGYEIFARLTARLAALQTIFVEAETAFGQRRCVSHMVLGPMSVEQWRRFHAVHGEHHLKQMRAIRSEMGL